jgi:hypothetical protein
VRSSCRATTRLNNEAVADASQGPEHGKSRKPLPQLNRAVNFANAAEQIRSRLRDFAAAGRRSCAAEGAADGLPEISDFTVKF